MTEKTLQFTSKVGPRDFMRLRLMLMYSGWRRRFWLIVVALAVAVLFIFESFIFPLIVAGYLVFVTSSVAIATLVRRDRDMYKPQEITVTPETFAFISPKHRQSFDWDKGISSYRKIGPYHLVFFTTGGFVIVPDREIPPDKKNEVIDLFRRKA